jgi:two-component system, sensor histidine kinase and response regulator
VDDVPENLLLIDAILQSQGFNIIKANNGVLALEKIRISPPHLILLDVMMPEMDGYELTQKIRRDTNLPYIPILLISAYDQASVVKGLDLGADDFIRKPVDIDELMARVRSLLRLKHSIDEREQMARIREDFVSRLTHDLRTPLVAAERMFTLMQQGALGDLSDNVMEVIDTMTRNNRNLLQMVNTLLEVYRYEADRKALYFTEVNLQAIILEVIRELHPLVEDKRLSLDFLFTPTENYTLMGDKLELRRMVTNLIANGIKFTTQGSVNVSLSLDVSESEQLIFAVADTGIGIVEEQKIYLFDRFRTNDHRLVGSGLGLYLSRQIIEKHHGTITVDSQNNQGTTFTVYLPLNCLEV